VAYRPDPKGLTAQAINRVGCAIGMAWSKTGVTLVTHDIGNIIVYAFAARFPERGNRWLVIDAPLPIQLIARRLS
jgi:pimeloyl-ACP methyl ester carboxylesterase